MVLIKNAKLINERKIIKADVLIEKEKISRIENNISPQKQWEIIDAEGMYLIPGFIDTHVHFREPGLTHEGTIETESKAAIAGGVTSFMDMPNTIPNATTIEVLEKKYQLATKHSYANYSFFFGLNSENLEEAAKVNSENTCGLTDDGLYFGKKNSLLCNQNDFLEKLFSKTDALIALHCEDEKLIEENEIRYRNLFGKRIEPIHHAYIRSTEACYKATKNVIQIAKKHHTRLHLLHISTAKETELFSSTENIKEKRITAEACLHHLYFNDNDYKTKGMLIKWNPSVKEEQDRIGLLNAIRTNKIDNIATDHAPHLLQEKLTDYFSSKSGAPSIQYLLPALLKLHQKNEISLEDIVEKTSHHPAEMFKMIDRGYIREGYYADLVLFDLNHKEHINKSNLHYKCKWSPFENEELTGNIKKVFVNGTLVFDSGKFTGNKNSKRLLFKKKR
jgi:dihydroorotase